MKDHIKTPEIREIIREEFMKPLKLNYNELAKLANMPVSQLQDIFNGKEKITSDTSARLGKAFGMSDNFFLNIQKDLERRNTDSLMETVHLLSSDTNRKHLAKSISQYKDGKTKEHNI